MTTFLGVAPRVRKSPYYHATLRYGAKAFTVYNHMLMPLYYESPEADYWNLVQGVTLWDVSVERQVQIEGPDAEQLVRLMTPRNLDKFPVGTCKYLPLVDEYGGMVNDPVGLRLAEDKFWLSLADSDVLLWAKGLAVGLKLDLKISEPDVNPLALQGPKAEELVVKVFGEEARDIKFFRFRELDFEGTSMIVARSGWSRQGGFEFYLRDRDYGNALWEALMAAGQSFNLKPGTPNALERVESGLLSYGTDMNLDTNPLEIGLDKFCDLDQSFDFLAKKALLRIREEGVTRKMVGLQVLKGEKAFNEEFWPLRYEGEQVGLLTSAAYSPRLKKNIALAIAKTELSEPGTTLWAETPDGVVAVKVVSLPFLQES